jgi:hypothetical protein
MRQGSFSGFPAQAQPGYGQPTYAQPPASFPQHQQQPQPAYPQQPAQQQQFAAYQAPAPADRRPSFDRGGSFSQPQFPTTMHPQAGPLPAHGVMVNHGGAHHGAHGGGGGANPFDDDEGNPFD